MRRFLPAVLLLVLLAGFGFGLARLLDLRLAGGDVFPAYSTLRSDALGAKALHDSLAELPDLRVERAYRTWRRQFAPAFVAANRAAVETVPLDQTTLFVVGLEPQRWPYLFRRDELDTLEELTRRGLRVVLTFRPLKTVPTTQSLRHQREEEEERLKKAAEKRDRHDRDKDGEATPPPAKTRHEEDADKKDAEDARRELSVMFPVDVSARWKLDFHRVRLDGRGRLPDKFQPPPDPSVATPAAGSEARVGAETVSWHSLADWDADPPAAAAPPALWHALLRRNRGRAVLVERSFGAGSIALATDSFFLSNEALAGDDRHAALLAALVGPKARRIIFDERHLGVSEDPGMMTLVRRYGLDGALAALGLLVALFLWRNATSLAPPRPEPVEVNGAEGVAGREASAGFGALLRRGVAVKELVPTLLARWESAHHRPTSALRVARLREIAASRSRPAEAYRAMRAALK